jgi:hypothetical protein
VKPVLSFDKDVATCCRNRHRRPPRAWRWHSTSSGWALFTGLLMHCCYMSLSMLVTGNPIAAVGSHVAMHTAAVLHGPATTIQLPPHY